MQLQSWTKYIGKNAIFHNLVNFRPHSLSPHFLVNEDKNTPSPQNNVDWPYFEFCFSVLKKYEGFLKNRRFFGRRPNFSKSQLGGRLCHALVLWRDFELFFLSFLKLNRYPNLFWGKGGRKLIDFFGASYCNSSFFCIS